MQSLKKVKMFYCIYYKGTQSSNKHVQGKRQDKSNRMHQNELHTATWAANSTLEGVHEFMHLQMYTLLKLA